MNGDDNVSNHPSPEKRASRRRKASKMTRPRSASAAKNRGKSNQQPQQQQPQKQHTGSRMRGGGDGSNRNSGSSSAPQLRGGDSTAMAAGNTSDGDPPTAGNVTNSVLQEGKDGRRRLFEHSKTPGATAIDAAGVPEEATHDVGPASIDEAQGDARLLQQLKRRNQEIESRRRQLEHRCTQLEVEASSKQAELQAYKAEVRAKTIAVGKAEIILNDICLSMARRVGRADGVQVSESKGGVLLEVHETPAEFAAQIKKNILAQLTKWEIDRAALKALAESAGGKAADAAKLHEAERADLLERAETLEERIREMEVESQRQVAEAKAVAEQSREESEKASSAKGKLVEQLEAAASRTKELCKNVQDNEKEFQAQLDRFMEYPKAAERMAEELERCQKSARREKNLMCLERKEFRRQLHMFQKWQTENKVLRERAKLQEMQILTLRRQLAVTEAGLSGSTATRKAVMEGTVDRLQRAETAARHQANKYRELAGARGVQLAQLETEVSSLKATNKNLRRMLEPPANDTYETEIARLARVHPEVLEIQQKPGLNKEDMEATMAELKLLREKEEQKDSLIALARERDEFELCVKDLRARNSWLEKQVLGAPGAVRSVAQERVKAVAQTEGAELSRRAEARADGGWTGTSRCRGDDSRAAGGARKSDAVSRLEQRLEVQQGHSRGAAETGGEGRLAGEPTARIRRNIKFLEDCDRSIEKQREREAASCTPRTKLRDGGGGPTGVGGVAAAHAARRQRPQSAQGISRRPTSSSKTYGSGKADATLCGLFRGCRPVSAGCA